MSIVTLMLLLVLAICLITRVSSSRSAEEVLFDLQDDSDDKEIVKKKRIKKNWIVYISLIISIAISYYYQPVLGAVSFFLIVFSQKFLIKRKINKEKMLIARVLPLTMERLVMTIEAGHDVISACKIIIKQDQESGLKSNLLVSRHLEEVIKLTENGLSFTESLKQVSREVSGTALSQTFIHLALAYSQGGELIAPLRELSDATQLAYQETIEEEIAKLPVKATVPLLLIFAGLILFFITPPFLEVQKLTNTELTNSRENEI